MTQKNETPVLLLSLLATLLLLGGGFWWFSRRLQPSPITEGQPSIPGDVSLPDSPQDLANRLSSGERLLAPNPSAEKQAGIAAYAAQDYAQAVSALEASLQAQRNDPEALIYLNNARIGADRAYTIAVSVPIGNSVNPALEILRGVAQAQQQINESGGVNGTPLKVLIASDDNEPEVARQVANVLVQYPDVLGVVGHFGSDATLAAGEVYEQGKLVMISPTSTSVQVANLGGYIFRTVPSDRFTAAALSRYMLSSLQRQNAVVYYNSTSDYSQSLKNEFATTLTTDGGQVVAEFDLADPGFNPLDTLKQAAQQDAEVLVLASNTATLDAALQVVAVNRRDLPLLGGDSVYNPKTLQVGGEAAVGMVVAVPWVLLANPQTSFAQTAKTLWGGDVNWRTAMAYDATLSLAAALQQDPSREGVQQALSSPGFSVTGATGTVRFLPSGDRNQAMQLVVVEPGSRSGYGYDFVPVP